MIGQTMFRVLAQRTGWEVCGSVRNPANGTFARPDALVTGVDLSNPDQLCGLFRRIQPDVVVNCAGLTKHVAGGNDPVPAMTMNALLPHRLADLCAVACARLIHVSTDCVFAGFAGNYREEDAPDARDVYGRTKAMGEVTGDHVVTLRTSTIGHENGSSLGLVEWFLRQSECKGFRRAIFSGLPTVEFARVVRDIVVPEQSLHGLYHVGAAPIDKFSLLVLISQVYGLKTSIVEDDTFRIDRSLNVDRFAAAAGYRAPPWPDLVQAMYNDHFSGK